MKSAIVNRKRGPKVFNYPLNFVNSKVTLLDRHSLFYPQAD